ncbi:MAG: nucleotide excision repair endonuclease, partial [Candidatus Moranbacteria bacterium]|nr:nucleotide excision repair endonuclease [Candidatus Moranbacteria bacterium]
MKTIDFDGSARLEELKTLPETPGVYFFLDDAEEILYIGKATSLRDRVRSYFASDLMDT